MKIIAISVMSILVIILSAFACIVTWNFIQDELYDNWGIKLPPIKTSWYSEWKDTNKLTLEIVPQKIFECSCCNYCAAVKSRCCPACGKHMNNWDPEWDTHGVITKEDTE